MQLLKCISFVVTLCFRRMFFVGVLLWCGAIGWTRADITSSSLVIKNVEASGVTVQRNQRLVLSCASRDAVTYTKTLEWYIPTQPNDPITATNSNQPIYVKRQTSNDIDRLDLIIQNIDENATGFYTCKRMNRQGQQRKTVDSVRVQVSVRQIPSYDTTNCQRVQWIYRESINPKIYCQVKGNPSPSLSWYHNQNELKPDGNYFIGDSDLQIMGKLRAGVHDGLYKVEVNPGLSPSSSKASSPFIIVIQVRLFDRPKITTPAHIVGGADSAREKERTDVQCLATGNPPPLITWRRKSLRAMPRRFRYNSNPAVGTLRIFQPIFEQDEDTYVCRAGYPAEFFSEAQRPYSFAESAVRVDIAPWPRFRQLDQMDRWVGAGDTATLKCRVRAWRPVMQWQRYDYARGRPGQTYRLGSNTNDDPRISVRMVSDEPRKTEHTLYLTIKSIKFEDSANYTCIVSSAEWNRSRNGTIRVEREPVLDSRTALTVFGSRHNATNMTCVVHGLPHPKWKWSRGGTEAQLIKNPSSRETARNTTFRVISQDHDTWSQSWLQVRPSRLNRYFVYLGPYTCLAENRLGYVKRQVNFLPIQPPLSPEVTLLARTASSLKFRVARRMSGDKDVDSVRILGFDVEFGPRQSRDILYRVDQIVYLTGLFPARGYEINFFARNIVGRSKAYVARVNTLAMQPPDTVKVISQPYSTSPFSYALRWKVPENGGDPLRGYQIHLRPVNWPLQVDGSNNGVKDLAHILMFSNNWKALLNKYGAPVGLKPWRTIRPELVNPYTNEFMLLDLEPNTMYQLTIQAWNKYAISDKEKSTFVFKTPYARRSERPKRVYGAGHSLLSQPTQRFTLTCLFLSFSCALGYMLTIIE